MLKVDLNPEKNNGVGMSYMMPDQKGGRNG